MDYSKIRSLPQMILERAAREGAKPFLWAKHGGKWTSTSWLEFAEQVRILGRALIALGVKRGDRVALIAENRPEWLIADYAIMSIGALTVPGYSTNTVDDNRHIFTNAGVAAAIASTRTLAERALAAAGRSPTCRTVVAIEPPELAQDSGVRLVPWADAMALGATRTDDIDAIVADLRRDDIACVIHTSGTGGLPKGVSLHHGAMLANCEGADHLLRTIGFGVEAEVYLSFLPLSHAYEHTVGGALMPSIGAQIYYAEGTDKLASNMIEVRPTIMTAVPRLYETLHARISQQMTREGGLKAKLFAMAVAIGAKRHKDPRTLTLLERLVDPLLDRLVRDKVRARFGGRLKALVSGGAPLNPEIGLYFTALGLILCQGYGQTETGPVVSANLPRRIKLDTVGPPFKGVEVRIAEDGEILIRGELVMKGYWNDEAATAATIRDGWLHTGDIGLIDEDGYLKITDRKKDFIKNSGGDMIAPARIEGMLAMQPEIAQAMVHGDRRPYLVALVVPRDEAIKAAATAAGKPAELAVLADDPGLRATVERAIERVNKQLSATERVRKFLIAPDAFTVANEMMTPTLKIRRHRIRATHGDALDALYR
ncbi:MAG: long-chain fatty acid--CoA ligase [Alphaproteobacteria bacterium]|nr:long-chain fatty acid--CoA ligase [Alphaproteobacteria bacterium]